MIPFLGRRPPRRNADPLLAAAARILGNMPHLAERHFLEPSSRFAIVRIVHVAAILHAGRHDRPMLDETAEATSCGPLHPRLFEASRSRRRLISSQTKHMDARIAECLDDACRLMDGMTSGAMIQLTHAEGGAWAARYDPVHASSDRGPAIRHGDLLDEYAARPWEEWVRSHRAGRAA